ncbi:ABC transporter permease [Amphibacillus cookii]|uniref:ABC transporter permease n=1 Tax=Amphibacillus cookii TaxID=767787 RepID=UPI001958B6E4|nr:ABC transporter permease [Amphibacillus cookii]MBM7541501.1 ABC-2 type transport system permease protein [Amphibacillus cookii]
MIDSKTLFKSRIRAHLKETVRYLQFIFNGHIAIALFFLIGAGAVFYQQLLADLPEDFPTVFVISIAFSMVVLYNPIQNFLKEADMVFLLPAESQLYRYFNYTLAYSFLIQLYLVALVAALLAPLFQTSYPAQSYSGLLVLFVLFKAWHFIMTWWSLRLRSKQWRFLDKVSRFVIQFLIFYSFISDFVWLLVIFSLLLFTLFLYLYVRTHRHLLAWDQLIVMNQQRMQSFYRLASMFTDVPHFKASVKKRTWLVRLATQSIAFRQEQTYSYLYRITFIRSADYLGIYLRLTAICGLALLYLTHLPLILMIIVLFLYLTGIQLISLWYHHRTSLWIDLYPVANGWRKQSFVHVVERLLFGQLLAYLVIVLLLTNWFAFISIFLVGTVFIMGFSRIYMIKKISKT